MNRWGRDKWKHLLVCIPLGIMLQAGAMFFLHDRPATALYLSISIMVFIAYMFEVFSLITDLGYYELLDAIASITGGVLGILLFFCLKTVWR